MTTDTPRASETPRTDAHFSIKYDAFGKAIEPGILSEGSYKFCCQLERDLATAQAALAQRNKELRIAAGMISTLPQFADKHPEEALKFIQDAARKQPT